MSLDNASQQHFPLTKTQSDAILRVKSTVGPAGWISPAEDAKYSQDWRGSHPADPVLIVRPTTVTEIAEVVSICSASRITIVCQGGNTGLSGGALPYSDRPNIILSTTRMRSIIDIDPDGFTITAEAGVTIEELQDAARAVGRELAIDWGARGTATLGGAISTDAGGINVLRSGTMRNQVLGIEVVLPDGQVWNGLRALRKDSSGYGLKHLFIGGEGTLGLVTKAILKLEVHRAERQSFMASVTDFDRLPELYSLAQETGQHALSAFELIPKVGIDGVCAKFTKVTSPVSTMAEWYVLGQFTGNLPVEELIADFLAEASERGLIDDAVIATSSSQEENLWTLRDELPPERLFGVKGAKFDAAVPTSQIPAYHNDIVELAQEIDAALRVYAFGHLGDGNLHLYVHYPADVPRSEMSAELKSHIEDIVDRVTWKFGGTISAEHGVGQELRDRMTGQKSEVELDLLSRIKNAIDPSETFNPGRGSHGSRDRYQNHSGER